MNGQVSTLNGVKGRRKWSAEEKLRILEEARQADYSASEVCRWHQVAPGQFYLWEKQAREGALQASLFGKRGCKGTDPRMQLQAEVEKLRIVVSELSAENLQLKKGLWP